MRHTSSEAPVHDSKDTSDEVAVDNGHADTETNGA